MVLKYHGSCGGGNILADLGRFNKVSEYLEALVSEYKERDSVSWRTLKYLPLNVFVSTPKNKYWVVEAGKITPKASKCIQEIKEGLPQYNEMMSETLLIEGDSSEQELSFYLII